MLRSRVQQESNSLLVNALNRIFKNPSLNNFKWLLTKLELSCIRNIIPRSKSGASKSRPRWAAHTRIGNVWEFTLRGFDAIIEQPDPKGIIPLLGEPKSLILHYLPSISSGWLYFPRALLMLLLWSETKFYYIHFEITGDPCNLIGSQQCDLFTNHTIFCS